MQFAQDYMFHLLWGIPVLILFLRWAKSHHIKTMQKFAQEQLMQSIAYQFDAARLKRKSIFVVSVFILSIAALSRPQWGFEWQEVKRHGIDILVVIDVSKSMLTQDVKPNRLERTKLAVTDLVRKLKGDRIGLMAFAGDAFLTCPLTVDYSGYLLSLNDLNVKTIPRGGTNITIAIEKAINTYEEIDNKFKAIIIVTDGDNLEGNPLKAAEKAKFKNIKIYCIGIGTKEGELIQIPNDQGEVQFVKDNQGNFVKSRLNEDLLQKIALTTGGIYVKASGIQFGLDLIYEKELSKLEKREILNKMEKRYYERFQIPLGLALMFLLIDTCTYTRKKKQK